MGKVVTPPLLPGSSEPAPFTHRVESTWLGQWQVQEPGGTYLCSCRNEATARRIAALLDAELAGNVAPPEAKR